MGAMTSSMGAAYYCYMCHTRQLSDHNPYFFRIFGLGKHHGKEICSRCLRSLLIKSLAD